VAMPRETGNHTQKVLMSLKDTLPRSQGSIEVGFAE
jgi:hypothetical protein